MLPKSASKYASSILPVTPSRCRLSPGQLLVTVSLPSAASLKTLVAKIRPLGYLSQCNSQVCVFCSNHEVLYKADAHKRSLVSNFANLIKQLDKLNNAVFSQPLTRYYINVALRLQVW